MHGNIKKASLHGSLSQPDFKHWWKVYDGTATADIYFTDDNPLLVVVGSGFYIVDPTNGGGIKDANVVIYHVASKTGPTNKETCGYCDGNGMNPFKEKEPCYCCNGTGMVELDTRPGRIKNPGLKALISERSAKIDREISEKVAAIHGEQWSRFQAEEESSEE